MSTYYIEQTGSTTYCVPSYIYNMHMGPSNRMERGRNNHLDNQERAEGETQKTEDWGILGNQNKGWEAQEGPAVV
jgi:hypothetical protein